MKIKSKEEDCACAWFLFFWFFKKRIE